MARKDKNAAAFYVKVNLPEFAGQSFKVLREDGLSYHVVDDSGKHQSFFKCHCALDRSAIYKALSDKREKARMIGTKHN